MLYCDEQLNIGLGLVSTYKRESEPGFRMRTKTKNRYKSRYNYKKFEGFSRNKFILFCVWFIAENNILLFDDFVYKVNNYNKEEFERFIMFLKIHKVKCKEEISNLQKQYGNLVKHRQYILNEYIRKNINFITLYSIYGGHLIELKESNTYNIIYKRLVFYKKMLRFKNIEFENQI